MRAGLRLAIAVLAAGACARAGRPALAQERAGDDRADQRAPRPTPIGPRDSRISASPGPSLGRPSQPPAATQPRQRPPTPPPRPNAAAALGVGLPPQRCHASLTRPARAAPGAVRRQLHRQQPASKSPSRRSARITARRRRPAQRRRRVRRRRSRSAHAGALGPGAQHLVLAVAPRRARARRGRRVPVLAQPLARRPIAGGPAVRRSSSPRSRRRPNSRQRRGPRPLPRRPRADATPTGSGARSAGLQSASFRPAFGHGSRSAFQPVRCIVEDDRSRSNSSSSCSIPAALRRARCWSRRA